MKKSESLKLLNASMSCNGLHSTQPFTKLEKVALRIMEAKLKNPETTHSKSSPQMALEMLLECEHLSREEEPLKPVMLDVPENGLIWCEDIEPSNKPRPETKVFHIPLETEDGYIIEEVVSTAQDIAETVALKKHKGSVLNYRPAPPPKDTESPVNYILHIEFTDRVDNPQQVRHTDVTKGRAVSYAKSSYPQGKLVKLEIVQQVRFDDIVF